MLEMKQEIKNRIISILFKISMGILILVMFIIGFTLVAKGDIEEYNYAVNDVTVACLGVPAICSYNQFEQGFTPQTSYFIDSLVLRTKYATNTPQNPVTIYLYHLSTNTPTTVIYQQTYDLTGIITDAYSNITFNFPENVIFLNESVRVGWAIYSSEPDNYYLHFAINNSNPYSDGLMCLKATGAWECGAYAGSDLWFQIIGHTEGGTETNNDFVSVSNITYVADNQTINLTWIPYGNYTYSEVFIFNVSEPILLYNGSLTALSSTNLMNNTVYTFEINVSGTNNLYNTSGLFNVTTLQNIHYNETIILNATTTTTLNTTELSESIREVGNSINVIAYIFLIIVFLVLGVMVTFWLWGISAMVFWYMGYLALETNMELGIFYIVIGFMLIVFSAFLEMAKGTKDKKKGFHEGFYD